MKHDCAIKKKGGGKIKKQKYFLLKSGNEILVKKARVFHWQLKMNGTATANKQKRRTITGKLEGLLASNIWSSFDTRPCKLT